MPFKAILADLVAFPSLPGLPNGAIAGYVQDALARHGVEVAVVPGPEGDRVNLFATIGPRVPGGLVLSGHMDVVPVEGQAWTSDPFRLTAAGDRLTARGTSDMKGFLACMLAMVPAFQAMPLARPVHLAFSYDEEIGCRGVPHLIARLPDLCPAPMGCVVGEPTDLRPVLSHKGKQALALTIEGQAGHSSNPAAGENALYPAAALLLAIRDRAARLAAEGPFDPRFDPPHSTLQAGVIRGGAAVNIIPDRVEVEVEARAIPAQAPQAVMAGVLADLEAIVAEGRALRATHRELSSYPALPPAEDGALAARVAAASGHAPLQSVSYGTEAGLFAAAGVPSIVCGPGSIARAHKADEFVMASELEACCAMLRRLAERLDA
ncbi:MAG: acetylornithine deacetylase [Amaricoccus sp.]|uniref:acetylornithine deacetylase n=1 Tax=Amaricoccus sp. TaxID=1872485 RepID=UPI0039E5D822